MFFAANFWACQKQSKTIQRRLRFEPEQKGGMGNRWSLAIFKKDFVDGLLLRITDCVSMTYECRNVSTFSSRTEK